MPATGPKADGSGALREHEQILMAIEDCNAELLKYLLLAHLLNGWEVAKVMVRKELADLKQD